MSLVETRAHKAESSPMRGASHVSPTVWGFVLRPSERVMARAAIFEILAIFIGVLFFLLAFGQWLLPGSLSHASVLPMKLAMTIIPMVMGTFLLLSGFHGHVVELQVDRAKHQIRQVRRNRRGIGRVTLAADFAEVTEVQATPLPRGGKMRLELRLVGQDEPVEVMTAPVSEILPLEERLKASLLQARAA